MTTKNEPRKRIASHDSLFWRFDDWLRIKLYQYVPKWLADILAMKRRRPVEPLQGFSEWVPHILVFAFLIAIATSLAIFTFS